MKAHAKKGLGARIFAAGLALAATPACAVGQEFTATSVAPADVPVSRPLDATQSPKVGIGAWLFVDVGKLQLDDAHTPVRAVVSLSDGYSSIEIGRINFFPFESTQSRTGPDRRRFDASGAIKALGGYENLPWSRLKAKIALEPVRAGDAPVPSTTGLTVDSVTLVPFDAPR